MPLTKHEALDNNNSLLFKGYTKQDSGMGFNLT